MTDKVVKIRPTVERLLSLEPVPEVVENLERLLAEAKAGRLRAVAVTGQTRDSEDPSSGVLTFWHRGEGGNIFALLGGLTLLQKRVLSSMD